MLKRLRRLLGRDTLTDTAVHAGQAAMTLPSSGATGSNEATSPDFAADNSAADPSDFVMPFEIRPLQHGDGEPLRQLFHDAIEQTASKHYAAEAIAAWSAYADDANFIVNLQQGLTLVATLHGDHAGFAQLHPANHIEMLYLAPHASGLGIASLLYQHLEDEARIAGCHSLGTASSLTAQRFFESMGWTVSGEEEVQRQGVAIKRLRMEKTLVSPARPR